MTGLKICGLQPGDDLSFAVNPVVTHTGMVFASRSRRYVAPAEARALSKRLRTHTTVMGVFVNASLDELLSVSATAGLDGVQLHGSESSELCQKLREKGLVVWKALSVPRDNHDIPEFAHKVLAYQGVVDAVLLDAPPPKDADSQVTGGHGVAFDWRDLEVLTRELTTPWPPIWVAGGVTPDNVGLLFDTFSPAGIDVSSGVEVSGRKSAQRIYALMEAVSHYAG
ncbi:phosphoribosylanthranilate isomerase [Alicyclobacillus sp. ALC3]|uniref:phosphoribosylanthranilate isomerase n=1 Tax=Alicyclobacillus sp. ALC3 TaxID=2796143 RepID=UPI0023786F01|nr:phosphoribosylanthranilate isomerase [Alicyclobacillus sp. ALC3]WDL97206.1 phosphoribosylanthranilate isomerase [Alicyclobacillus sp. ALC3]